MSAIVDEAKSFLNEHASLSSLLAIAQWRQRAERCIQELLQEAKNSDGALRELQEEAAELREKARSGSLFGRFFRSTEEKKVAEAKSATMETAASCRAHAETLQQTIDGTPSTDAERTLMLRELRGRKKDVQLEKRGLNGHMRDIRTDARQRSAGAATSITALLAGSKYTALERRNIRYEKERALAPHEDSKAAIDRQLLEVEREIARIERLT